MDSTGESRLIDSLRSPSAYPHRPDHVEVVETHISWVLLAGDRAYKLKKPVDLGFVDFSTLERRKHFCEEETRLNRRLAPELYLGVVPISGAANSPVIGGPGRPIEYAVEMRRFDQNALLTRVLERDELRDAHVDALAEMIARFHGRAAVAPPTGPYGAPDRIWRSAAENFAQVGDHDDADLRRRLAGRAHDLFAAKRETFAARLRAGFVRECHGDLHLGNLLLLEDRVVPFDGIEFNDDLRWIDVLSEVAFTVMDLNARGRPGQAWRLLNAYLARTGDYCGAAVLPFYLGYRAMVRAKVASIRLRQTASDGERQRLSLERDTYHTLADRYTRTAKPTLVITHGRSGSGKTTVSQTVAEALGLLRVRSDVERKRLLGVEAQERPSAGIAYSAAADDRTYDRLATCVSAILDAGMHALVDAAFLSRDRRADFRRLADRAGARFVILEVAADEALARRRLVRREQERRDASDAGVAVFERQLALMQPLSEQERTQTVSVDTGRPDATETAIAGLRHAMNR